jgi:hypothetical protein
MSMYKRPPRRVRASPPLFGDKPAYGSFLYDIIIPKSTIQFKFNKRPIAKIDDYIKTLEENNKRLGIPYIKPDLPQSIPYREPQYMKEPEILYGDRVQVNLRILKNGIIRLKVNTAIATMYDMYYHRGIQAPIKVLLQAYKSHGFSETFLERIKKSHDKKAAFAIKVPTILQKIFDKDPIKKIKKKKKEVEVEVEVEPEVEPGVEPDEEPDEIPEEGGELDMEPDDDQEEVVEEEYVSDPET